ncbi:MAG: radical SAM family heme chaperone HemW [Steroidobacter sp.]
MPLRLPPLSLYVHLPWCVRKCPYCDFNSHPAPPDIPQAQYIDALLEDLETDVPEVQGRRIASIFFGGGTPSLFSPDQVGRFLAGVRTRIGFEPQIEVTLEANPGTIEHGRFSGYREAGVNRVSLGAQTFNDEHLHTLGRIHGAGDITRAVGELQLAGLANFNLDLMYGLPGQTSEQAAADIDAAIELSPAHISHYQLTLEPGTVFYHRPPPLPDAEIIWQMQQECQERLASRGYAQYEVSAYAQAGSRCTHNLNYWRFGDYLGVGAGAHGKLTSLTPEAIVVRTTRIRQPREYLIRANSTRVVERVRITAGELPFEYMLNALRLIEGFEEASFEAHTGVPIAAVSATIANAERRGLLQRVGSTQWRPTELGQRFLNDLQALFLSEPARQPEI